VATKLKDGLNEGQGAAYDDITGWLSDRNSSDIWVLEGYAGTGKTFLLGRILRNALMGHPRWRIAITAPTNKAVKVAKRMCNIDDPRVAFVTVHRLLGLKEKITDDGRQVFERDTYQMGPGIESYGLVVVDEASMLNDELFKELELHRSYVKLLFVGDPAQIPPVGREDSIPFDKGIRKHWRINVAHLSEIMRQAAENPIIAASMQIRDALTVPTPIHEYKTLVNDGKGLIHFNMNIENERAKVQPLLEQLFNTSEFKDDPDHAKVVAWRNVTVNSMNNVIRSILYGKDVGKLVVGEKLIADKPIQRGVEILFTTNDEFEVISYTVKREIFGADDVETELEFYSAMVEKVDEEGSTRKLIRILHENSQIQFDRAAEQLKRRAIREKKGSAWRDYYDFIREFADVNYNYAITCHKAQGSTYKNVVIVEDDIEYNRNIVERNRIRYTAYTRPSQMLYVLKRT